MNERAVNERAVSEPVIGPVSEAVGRPVDGPDADPAQPVASGHAARTASILVGVVLLLFIALLATRKPSGEDSTANALVGKAVPRLVGTTLDGRRLDVDTLRGKWVVVNFFAPWCTGCVIEHPELVRFAASHQAKGDAEVVSVVFEDQPSSVKAFFERNGGSWPVIVSDDGRAAIDFGVTGIPESFVVAPNQLVVAHFNGVTEAALDDVIARYASKGPADTSGSSMAPSTGVPPGSAP